MFKKTELKSSGKRVSRVSLPGSKSKKTKLWGIFPVLFFLIPSSFYSLPTPQYVMDTELPEAIFILEVIRPQLLFAWLYLWPHTTASESADFSFPLQNCSSIFVVLQQKLT